MNRWNFARAVPLTSMAVLLAACTSLRIPVRGGGQDPGLPGAEPPLVPASGLPERPTQTEGRHTAIAGYKIVAAKEPPATLIAQGGRRCVVEAAKYERTKPGDEVFCVWTADEPR